MVGVAGSKKSARTLLPSTSRPVANRSASAPVQPSDMPTSSFCDSTERTSRASSARMLPSVGGFAENSPKYRAGKPVATAACVP